MGAVHPLTCCHLKRDWCSCCFLANLSPSLKDLAETNRTLQHAASAKKIKNKPRRNEPMPAGESEISQLQAEIERLTCINSMSDELKSMVAMFVRPTVGSSQQQWSEQQ